jgi:hypothetical protein
MNGNLKDSEKLPPRRELTIILRGPGIIAERRVIVTGTGQPMQRQFAYCRQKRIAFQEAVQAGELSITSSGRARTKRKRGTGVPVPLRLGLSCEARSFG